jgi:hypothetical protein
MSFTLTPIVSDTFHRANESPLNTSTWNEENPDGEVLCIVSDVCTTSITEGIGDGYASYIDNSLPDNQYAQVEVSRITEKGTLWLYLRAGAPGFTDLAPSYAVGILGQAFSGQPGQNANFIVVQYDSTGGSIVYTFTPSNGVNFTLSTGDVITFGVIGTQSGGGLVVLQNGNVLGHYLLSASPSTIASGRVGLQLDSQSSPPVQSDIGVINFAAGQISAP